MTEEEPLSTITIGGSKTPTTILCEGHVDAATFNKAFKEEGWEGGADVKLSELRLEYWVQHKAYWKRAWKDEKNTVPVTVYRWGTPF